jgi:hypothetical protein
MKKPPTQTWPPETEKANSLNLGGTDYLLFALPDIWQQGRFRAVFFKTGPKQILWVSATSQNRTTIPRHCF